MTNFYKIWVKAKFTGINMKLGYSTIESLNIVKPKILSNNSGNRLYQYFETYRNNWKLLVKILYVLKLFTSKH